jgi:hypothetical protein
MDIYFVGIYFLGNMLNRYDVIDMLLIMFNIIVNRFCWFNDVSDDVSFMLLMMFFCCWISLPCFNLY